MFVFLVCLRDQDLWKEMDAYSSWLSTWWWWTCQFIHVMIMPVTMMTIEPVYSQLKPSLPKSIASLQTEVDSPPSHCLPTCQIASVWETSSFLPSFAFPHLAPANFLPLLSPVSAWVATLDFQFLHHISIFCPVSPICQSKSPTNPNFHFSDLSFNDPIIWFSFRSVIFTTTPPSNLPTSSLLLKYTSAHCFKPGSWDTKSQVIDPRFASPVCQ